MLTASCSQICLHSATVVAATTDKMLKAQSTKTHKMRQKKKRKNREANKPQPSSHMTNFVVENRVAVACGFYAPPHRVVRGGEARGVAAPKGRPGATCVAHAWWSR